MAHVFDLSSHIPDPYVTMTAVTWYGIPFVDSAPTSGADATQGLWTFGQAPGWHAGDADAYPWPEYVRPNSLFCMDYHGELHRDVASKLRPLTGLYSSTGLDVESRSKIALDLGVIRRPGDPRGRVDVWAASCSTRFGTYVDGTSPGDGGFNANAELMARGFEATLQAAVDEGLGAVVTAEYLGGGVHLVSPPHADPRAVQVADIEWVVNTLLASPAGHRINGRVVIYQHSSIYVPWTDAEWHDIHEDVRALTGHDHYVIAFSKTHGSYTFADGLHPFVSYMEYDPGSADNDRDRAKDWQTTSQANLLANVSSYPGRVVLASYAPGFDDWTKGGGAGIERFIPRTEGTTLGQFDVMATQAVSGVVLCLWNDWGEGSCIEPDVTDRGAQLGWMTEGLAAQLGETVDPDETEALLDLWRDYGINRTCLEYNFGAPFTHHAPYTVGGTEAEPHQFVRVWLPDENVHTKPVHGWPVLLMTEFGDYITNVPSLIIAPSQRLESRALVERGFAVALMGNTGPWYAAGIRNNVSNGGGLFHPPGTTGGDDVTRYSAPKESALAVQLLRSMATTWEINPNKIIVRGNSTGAGAMSGPMDWPDQIDADAQDHRTFSSNPLSGMLNVGQYDWTLFRDDIAPPDNFNFFPDVSGDQVFDLAPTYGDADPEALRWASPFAMVSDRLPQRRVSGANKPIWIQIVGSGQTITDMDLTGSYGDSFGRTSSAAGTLDPNASNAKHEAAQGVLMARQIAGIDADSFHGTYSIFTMDQATYDFAIAADPTVADLVDFIEEGSFTDPAIVDRELDWLALIFTDTPTSGVPSPTTRLGYASASSTAGSRSVRSRASYAQMQSTLSYKVIK